MFKSCQAVASLMPVLNASLSVDIWNIVYVYHHSSDICYFAYQNVTCLSRYLAEVGLGNFVESHRGYFLPADVLQEALTLIKNSNRSQLS